MLRANRTQGNLKAGRYTYLEFSENYIFKLRVCVDDILQQDWQTLDSITEFTPDTNADQITFTFLYLVT
jgi:hypothetical protein